MDQDRNVPAEFISAEGDTLHFTPEEVAKALLFFVSEQEAAEVVADLYAVDPRVSGIAFDETFLSALETVSTDVAERVAALLQESPEETKERRARFQEKLRSG